jgi:hypothetical protein
MQEIDNPRFPRDTLRDGLRILAKIIAREVVNGRLVKMEGLPSDPPSQDVIHTEFADIPKQLPSNLSPILGTKPSRRYKR